MLNESIQVLQSRSISDWSVRIAAFSEFNNADDVGRCLTAHEKTVLRCPLPMLLDRPCETSLFFPRGGNKPYYDVPLAEVRLDSIPSAQLVGGKFVVVSHDLKVFPESYWAEQNLNDRVHFQQQTSTIVSGSATPMRPTILFRERPPKHKISGSALLLGNPWSFNYHHWIINCLSKLWWTEYCPELSDVPLIVPAELKPFHLQSLAAMEMDSSRLLPFDGGPWLVERLYFPANGDFWPDQLAWIRQRLFQHYGITEGPGTRLLYISRNDAPGRRIVNEAEVIEFLSRRGFEVLQLDSMPLGEQMRAFARAKVVIGPHGSGLTNILFGATDLSLLELHPDDEINHVFWVLASALQQRYAFLSGRRINAERDFTVEIADLERLLGKFI